jgi:hypothetical protein
MSHNDEKLAGLALTLNVITKNLAVTLGTTLSETLSTFSTARHC